METETPTENNSFVQPEFNFNSFGYVSIQPAVKARDQPAHSLEREDMRTRMRQTKQTETTE